MALKKQLDTPYDIDVTISTIEVNTLAIDPANNLVHIGYSIIEDNGNVFQSDLPETLEGTDYTDFLARTNELGNTLDGSVAQRQAALEYSPGAGTIVGTVKTLNTPYVINGTVMGYDVDSFAYNTADQIIYIGYSKLSGPSTNLITDVPYTLSGPEYENFMTRLNELSLTMTVIQAEIQTCLEFLPDDGTIIDI